MINGKQKAAMLLMCLDPATASELLKGQPPHIVEDIAMELARIDANSDLDDNTKIEVAKEFCASIHSAHSGNMNVRAFVNDILNNNNGSRDGAKAVQAMQQKDPYVAICAYNPGLIAAALEGEHPQTMAIVISEMPTKIATEILKRIDEQISRQIVHRMTKHDAVPPTIKRKVGEMISKRLESMTPEDAVVVEQDKSKQILRNIALVLSGLDKQLRDALLDEIADADEEIGKTVKALLVTWEDITKIADRSLQQAMRNIEPAVLAKALIGADERIATKIKKNISERNAAMVDEETQLMAKPTKREITLAREEVVKPLREANEAEELAFVEQDE